MIIVAFFLTWIMSTLTFVAGYALGKGTLTKTTYSAIKKELEHKIYPHYKQPSGIIQRPDAKRVHEIQHPEIEEEKQAMRESLAQGIQPLTQ